MELMEKSCDSVLAKARAFLPMMHEANAHLEAAMQARPPEAFDIENLTDEAAPHVQMVRSDPSQFLLLEIHL